jgi:solute carrier family 25 phosphate transporter 23/24/25/41
MSLPTSKNIGTIRKRATAPLNYIDGTAEDISVVNGGKALQIPLKVNGGSATVATDKSNDAINYFLTKMIPMATITAVLVTLLTQYLANFSSPAAQAVKLVYAGAIAGIISRTFCAPIEMVSTVMMCRGDQCSTMSDELSKTWHKEGFKGMFKGNGANCLKVAPSRGTQFLVYEFVKRRMLLAGVGLAASSGSLHAGARLCAGGIAGMVAAAIVYPLEVVKTMLTLYPERCSSIPGALKMVYNSSGIGGLYRGLGPTLVAMFPYVGVEFMVYETLKKRWEMHIGPVGTLALLLLGAAGGAAAQASAHPLDVIRRRMQMQSMVGLKKDDDKEEKKYSNMFSGLYQVGKKEGIHVLFKGLGPACFEKIPSTAIGYFIYEFLKVTLKVSSV